MKGWVACACLFAAAALSAQAPMSKMPISSADDYSRAMKEVGTLSAALRKSIATPSEADAAITSARLEVIFKDVQAYWEDRKVEDAATFSKNAAAAARGVTSAVVAHDTTAAGAANQTLAGTCTACHTAHRDRLPDGSFKMK